jgi:hypothetical protein
MAPHRADRKLGRTEAEMPKLTVITEGGRYEIENDTVANVAELFEAVRGPLNIPANATAQVNGAPATGATPLVDGDEVATTKPAGAKGV